MTDEELKKALHWCGEDACSGCPLEKYYPARCRLYLTSEAYGRISLLEAENDALRERLEKAILNKCVYYINSVWNDATMTRKNEVCCGIVDYACDKFIEIKGITLSWNEIYFTYEAAEARLAE